MRGFKVLFLARAKDFLFTVSIGWDHPPSFAGGTGVCLPGDKEARA
jgi:hypothetical protein